MYASFKNITVGPPHFSSFLEEQAWSGVAYFISLFALSEHGAHKDLEQLNHSLHLCSGSSGSSFNGAFLPECVSDQCFRTAVASVAAAVCQWKYAPVPPSVRVRFMVGVALADQGHLDVVGGHGHGRISSSIMRNAFRKIARGFGRAAIEARLRPHCAAGRQLTVTDGAGPIRPSSPSTTRTTCFDCLFRHSEGGRMSSR